MPSWDQTLAGKASAARQQGATAYGKFYKSCTPMERTALDMMAKRWAAEATRVLNMPPDEQITELNCDPEADAYTAFSNLIKDTEKRLGRGTAHRVFAKWKDILDHKLDLKNEMLMRLLKAMPNPNVRALAREIALGNEELPEEMQEGWGSTNEEHIRRRFHDLLQELRIPGTSTP
jgi:hypothetical protein